MDRLSFEGGLAALWTSIQAANRYVEQKKPWELAKADAPKALDDVLRVLLEVLRLSSILCIPFMPTKAAGMREQLGLDCDTARASLDEARAPGEEGWRSGQAPVPLFPKIEQPDAT
jgi:methionyl-tRNA synthetase